MVICTLPAAANFTLPDELLTTTAHKPVILDVVYKPASTRLIKQVIIISQIIKYRYSPLFCAKLLYSLTLLSYHAPYHDSLYFVCLFVLGAGHGMPVRARRQYVGGAGGRAIRIVARAPRPQRCHDEGGVR